MAAIQSGEVEKNRIIKTVLVVDEAQDMNADEAALIQTLMKINDNLRIIAVGDDDQNIFAFRGSSSQFMRDLLTEEGAAPYELTTNYRSAPNLVTFANQFIGKIPNRLRRLPMTARTNENGAIAVVKFPSSSFVTPLVNTVCKTPLSGSVGILTRVNQDAEAIAGLLSRRGYRAKLIQSNSDFSLSALAEVRFFIEQINRFDSIPAETWEEARRMTIQTFPSGKGIEVCKGILAAFETANPVRKYLGDFSIFLRESKMEDFTGNVPGDVILVSTMHRAKGREFDTTFMLAPHPLRMSDEERRLWYVAMTRSRTNLVVMTDSSLLDSLQVEDLQRIEDTSDYGESCEFPVYLSHRDIYLGATAALESQLGNTCSGDSLVILDNGLGLPNGKMILVFSNTFSNQLANYRQRGYEPTSAQVEFVVWWAEKDSGHESRIVLPSLVLTKQDCAL